MRFEQLYPRKTPKETAGQEREQAAKDIQFNEKWKNPQKIMTQLGETITLYDLKPEHEKTPVPVMLWGGFSGVADHAKKNLREFYALDRRSMTVEESHGVDYDRRSMPLDKRALDSEYRKVTANIAALDSAGVEKTDAIAHSKGCIEVLLAATAHPERFRNIILIEPAGMNLHESLVDIIVRNQLGDLPSLKRELEAIERSEPGYQWDIHPDDSDIDDITLSGREITRHPIRSLKEIYSMAKIRVVDLLRGLKEKGIGIAIVQGVDDEMFRSEEMIGKPLTHEALIRQQYTMTGEMPVDAAERLAAAWEAGEPFVFDKAGELIMDKTGSLAQQKKAPTEDIRNIVDGFYSVKGIHTRFYHQPKEYTRLVDGALSALAAKKGEV